MRQQAPQDCDLSAKGNISSTISLLLVWKQLLDNRNGGGAPKLRLAVLLSSGDGDQSWGG